MSKDRKEAAVELEKARQNVRELSQAGKKVTQQDTERVANAEKNYNDASK